MSLSVSTRLLDNTIVISDVHHNTTVNSLKEDIADQCNLNVNKFNLLLEGDELIDTKLVCYLYKILFSIFDKQPL